MTAAPRVIITQFDTVDHAGFTQWISFQERVVGVRGAGRRTRSHRTVWQLVSGNHRVLARSASIHPTVDAAQADALELIAALDRVEIVPVSMGRRGMQSWYLTLDGRPELIGSRTYVADRERVDAAQLALSSLSRAIVQDLPRLSVSRTRVQELRS